MTHIASEGAATTSDLIAANRALDREVIWLRTRVAQLDADAEARRMYGELVGAAEQVVIATAQAIDKRTNAGKLLREPLARLAAAKGERT